MPPKYESVDLLPNRYVGTVQCVDMIPVSSNGLLRSSTAQPPLVNLQHL